LNFNYKDVLSRILDCPTDNRTKSARNFWRKETVLFKKLYLKYQNESFWSNLNLHDCKCKNGRISSLAFFLDKKNKYWSGVLYRKWKLFHWSPKPFSLYKPKKDIESKTLYPINKKTMRKFFDNK
jgi:hypothetical protein